MKDNNFVLLHCLDLQNIATNHDPRISRIANLDVLFCPKFLDLYASIYGMFKPSTMSCLQHFDVKYIYFKLSETKILLEEPTL